MSWREPNPFEKDILQDAKESWEKDYPAIITLAQCLTLAPRIEPLLLRNVRLRFVPQAQAEAESLLWFSTLVAARSTRDMVFHPGIAKVLAEDLRQDRSREELADLWQFTCLHTRHWSAEERMERDLRYYSLLDEEGKIAHGLRDILRRILAETDERRKIALSRLVKRSLPMIAPQAQPLPDEARLLAQYAALALGDAGAWAKPGQPQTLPGWLAAQLPNPISQAWLGIEVFQDNPHIQVLHLTADEKLTARVEFPGPLPAMLYVAAEGRDGSWHSVSQGSRILINPPSLCLRLITLDGRQWKLSSDPPDPLIEGESHKSPLLLSHVEADAEQAKAIAAWLQSQGLEVQLVAESALAATTNGASAPVRVVRLWTRAAQDFWADQPLPQTEDQTDSLLLCTEAVELPVIGGGLGHVLDWRDWNRLEASPKAQQLLDNLRRWRDGGEIESDPLTKTDEGRSGFATPTETFEDDTHAQKVSDGVANPDTPNAKPISPPGGGVGERGQMEFPVVS